MSITTLLAALLITLLALCGAGFYTHHLGYTSGQAQRDSYYAAMIRNATTAQQAAEARAEKLQQSANDIAANIEKEHEQVETTLAQQASAAQSRIADLLRQHTPSCAANPPAVPPVAPSPSGAATSPPGADSPDRLAAALTDLARRCESDANRLGQFQEWYRQQQIAHH